MVVLYESSHIHPEEESNMSGQRSDNAVTEETMIRDLLAYADVRIDGDRPWDITVHNPAFYKRVLAGGSLALGESYMDGWWDCNALDSFAERILAAGLDRKVRDSRRMMWNIVVSWLFNFQKKSRAWQIGERHYDIGNDVFRNMLDSRMVYSCGYWKDATDLDRAQEAKLDLTCRKLGLKPGQRMLDIGCGWGSMAVYAAEHYDVEVVGVTVSREQVTLCQELYRDLPVEVRLQDYRDVAEDFDHIVSIGMFEHVGYRNYRTFMNIVHRCLKPKGRFLLHTIGGNISRTTTDPWIEKYIFPNSMLPSAKQITEAAEGLFVLRDWHSFGTHYDKTLMSWYHNFITSWDRLKQRYDERFYRMWTYYLLTMAASFRANRNQLWQIVFTKMGTTGEYVSIR